ncbi:rubrerythrin-like domain-containing protein [Halorarum salinum]|uniref:Rubrerythrin-like domain-containing protein n=1 Tax=Halorarum salinum TaxID=2743089 RepID=A0A7D5QCC5_9EURY|nr:rubrerythrin-like domain-containing protein [Halobaculum salinum]QLG63657.1 rubrerythrin-like domain-containing protein [Halobaculum salinum]
MFDVPTDEGVESAYECLQCGTIVTADSHPGQCPDCGAEMQNRAMSLE